MKKILLLALVLFVYTPNTFAKDEPPITVSHDTTGVYVFKIDTKKMGNKIKPYVADNLTTTSNIFKNDEYQLVVNGGFFDPNTGSAVSYVTINGNIIQTPFSNMGLITSAGKENRLEGILNRAELRILENSRGDLSFDIDHHFAPVARGYKVKHSIQAGPIVYPYLDLEKECFVKMENDKVISQSADVLKKRERTVVGLKDGDLYLIIFTNKNKGTIQEICDFCKSLKLDKAMAFDGGASTSVNYDKIEVYSNIGAQRRVKSFLVVEK